MAKDTRSFFERITGSVRIHDDHDHDNIPEPRVKGSSHVSKKISVSEEDVIDNEEASTLDRWVEQEEEKEGQLTVDVYQNTEFLVIKTMVAGVRPEDLDITITRDLVIIKGKREEERGIRPEDYFVQELYWGAFSRTITLPAEVEVEEAEAMERHGLLIIKLPKIDKGRQAKLRVKTVS